MLITVARPAGPPCRAVALERGVGARVADIGHDSIMFELVGRPEQVESFEELVRPYGVRELARTGRVGLRRPSASGARSTPSVQV